MPEDKRSSPNTDGSETIRVTTRPKTESPKPVEVSESVTSPAPSQIQPTAVSPVPQPVYAPAHLVTSGPSAGTVVLQWLTYSFWGWAAIALTWLAGGVLNYFINSGSRGSTYSHTLTSDVAYPLAAAFVMFGVALGCDWFYSKREDEKKTGVSSAIMIIYAVLFGLAGIGALIGAVFAFVTFLVNPAADNSAIVAGLTSLLGALLCGASLVRVLRPSKLFGRVLKPYWIAMGALTALFVILSIVGPVVKEASLRDDRLIERGLSSVAEAVNTYTSQNRKLPSKLNDTTSFMYSPDAKALVKRGIVEFKPGEKVTGDSPSTAVNAFDTKPMFPYPTSNDAYKYQLCVTYKASNTATDTDYGSPAVSSSYPITSPNTSKHDAGHTCYDLVTSYYSAY